MDYQKTFLNIISTHLPKEVRLVDFISNIIHIGKEASYRRIRCEVEFTLSEVILIAKKLNINLNSIIISEGGNKTVFNLRLLPIEEYQENYIKRKKADLYLLEGFFTGKCTMSCVNRSIPDELSFDFPLLTKLKLLKTQFTSNSTIKHPLHNITIGEAVKQIQAQYMKRLSSIEIIYFFDPLLFEPIVADILFFSRIDLIATDEQQALKKELYALLEVINNIAISGRFKDKLVTLYVSHTSLEISTYLIKDKNLQASIVDLYNNNSILSFDPSVCINQQESLLSLKKFTSLITQSGEIDRAIFLNNQKKTIEQLY